MEGNHSSATNHRGAAAGPAHDGGHGEERRRRTQAEFGFVEDLLSTESLPDSALPTTYRSALVGALATNDRVTTTKHVDNPVGRDSTRVSWTSGTFTMALYLDHDGNFLASTQVVKDTGECGSRVITSQHRTKEIPQDLLEQLGSERVAKHSGLDPYLAPAPDGSGSAESDPDLVKVLGPTGGHRLRLQDRPQGLGPTEFVRQRDDPAAVL